MKYSASKGTSLFPFRYQCRLKRGSSATQWLRLRCIFNGWSTVVRFVLSPARRLGCVDDSKRGPTKSEERYGVLPIPIITATPVVCPATRSSEAEDDDHYLLIHINILKQSILSRDKRTEWQLFQQPNHRIFTRLQHILNNRASRDHSVLRGQFEHLSK